MLAIVERDLRKFLRQPFILIMSAMMPILQLVVVGNGLMGNLRDLPIRLVVQDEGNRAVQVRERLMALQTGPQRAVQVVPTADLGEAMQALKEGRAKAVLVIPPQFSRRVTSGAGAELGLLVDNTDSFSARTLYASISSAVADLGARVSPPRPVVSVANVEVYPYVPYIRFLLPGMVVMSIFMGAMIGGGIIYIDDKARGVHEGYLTTPLSKLDIVGGFTVAGTLKATASGFVVTLVGGLITRAYFWYHAATLLLIALVIPLISLSLLSFMFALMARVSDPILPRALFGLLNTLLYFPSGAMYPTESFPHWLSALSVVNPERYAVHALHELFLKSTGFAAIWVDVAFLAGFSAVMLLLGTTLFKRTLE
jgi:ABC-2 type transport system permease protein